MTQKDERLQILRNIQDGKITPEEGVKLLDALEKGKGKNNLSRTTEDGGKNQSSKMDACHHH